jgi:hypothetical protein
MAKKAKSKKRSAKKPGKSLSSLVAEREKITKKKK